MSPSLQVPRKNRLKTPLILVTLPESLSGQSAVLWLHAAFHLPPPSANCPAPSATATRPRNGNKGQNGEFKGCYGGFVVIINGNFMGFYVDDLQLMGHGPGLIGPHMLGMQIHLMR